MARVQPVVFRMFFTNEDAASEAQSQLNGLKVSSDRVKTEKDEYKVIFTTETVGTGEGTLRKLRTKPRLAQFFDPQADWAEGFKAVSLTDKSAAK
jgi:hypothetical protein